MNIFHFICQVTQQQTSLALWILLRTEFSESAVHYHAFLDKKIVLTVYKITNFPAFGIIHPRPCKIAYLLTKPQENNKTHAIIENYYTKIHRAFD